VLSKAYTVKVCKVSVSAKSKIEAAGGKIEEAATEEKEEA
jgi:ribosomal protein L15